MSDAFQGSNGDSMVNLGEWLVRLGPVFAVLFFVLVIGVGVTLVVISSARLLRRDGRRARADTAQHGATRA